MTAKQGSGRNQDLKPSRAPFFPFYADDWIAGTLDLTFEERGFFIAVLAAIWTRKGPIPLDHLPLALSCDKRQATRLVTRLTSLGKLCLDASNRVYNAKLNRLLQVTDRRSTAAQLRGEVREKSAGSPGEVQEKSANIFPETQAKTTTEPSAQTHPYPYPYQKEKKDTKLADTESVAAGEPEIGGLNGSTAAIVNGVARWLNNLVPDLETARRIVTTNTGIFGSDAVRRAFSDMQADVLDGKVIASPIKAFAGYCDSAKRQRPQASQPRDFISEKQQRSAKAIADAKALLAAQGGIQ